jgi:hypothetical protein
VLAYATSMVHKLFTEMKKPHIEKCIMNFFHFVDTINTKEVEIVRTNLPVGPSKEWMQRLNAHERKGC